MQNLSFDFKDHFFDFAGFRWAFRIFTLYNTYGLEENNAKIVKRRDSMSILTDRLFFAGRQKQIAGAVRVDMTGEDGSVKWHVKAQLHESIKGVGTLIKGIPSGRILIPSWEFEDIPIGDERVYSYPQAWNSWHFTHYLTTPIFMIEHEASPKRYTCFLSLDDEVRAKRFAVRNEGERGITLELHHEEDASKFSKKIITPVWKLVVSEDPNPIINERMQIMENAWDLSSWDTRKDVPRWLRKVSLVVNLHGMHWTGYVFNTYDQQLNTLRWIAQRIEGERILTFLPGWNGRYYINYPRYEPDPALGGVKGFRRLVEVAHDLGSHVIPMLGAVAVSFRFLEDHGMEEAVVRDKYGNAMIENWVDWDNDRETDNIWTPVNIGNPIFQDYLFEKISSLVDKFGIDGVFLDISHFWMNDRSYNFFQGMKDLTDRLHSKYSELLIFGEGWYDGLLGVTPLVHSHSQLPKNWKYFFLKYARMAYHLSFPAPGSGSTGVHELGYSSFTIPDPREDIIPTLSIVDDTIKNYPIDVQAVINSAKEYARLRGI